MRLTGQTNGGKQLTMSNLTSDEVDELLQEVAQWPEDVEIDLLEMNIKKWAAQNEQFTVDVDDDTGFYVTRIGRDADGALVCWERCQITDRHCFVKSQWVAESARESGYYRAMTQIGQYLIFEVMDLQGVMAEIADWSPVIHAEIERNGFTVFDRVNGKTIIGYTRAHYESVLKKERTFEVQQ